MEQILAIETIVSNPEIRSGRPVIAGTTIMVSDIAIYYTTWGWPPEEIAEQLVLPLGKVLAALAYYFEHEDEIKEEIAERHRVAEALREQLTHGRDQILP